MTVTVTQQPSPSVTPSTATEAAHEFAAKIKTAIPQFESLDDASLIDLGYTTCTKLSADSAKMYEVLKAFYSEGITEAEAGTFVAQAVVKLCPEKMDTLQQFLNQSK